MVLERAIRLAVVLSGLAPAQQPPTEVTRLNNEAVRLGDEGKYEESERAYRAALAIKLEDDLTRAKIDGNLAGLYKSLDRYADAERMYRRALELRRKNLPPASPEIAYSLDDLAQTYWAEGRYWEARNLLEAAVQALEKSDPPDPRLPLLLNNLAVIRSEFHEYDQAEKLLRRALSSCEDLHGPGSREFATALNNLAQVVEARKDFENAGLLYSKAIGIFESLGPIATADLAATLANLGYMCRQQNHYEEAERTEKRALAVLDSSSQINAPVRATILHNLGNIVAANGSTEASLPYFDQSLAIREKTLAPEHPATISVLLDYAKATFRAGRKSLAKQLQKRAERLLSLRNSQDLSQHSISLSDLRSER